MPRGDGENPKQRQELWGKPRPNRKRYPVVKRVPKNLAARQQWWEDFGTKTGDKVTQFGSNGKYTNADGVLFFKKPGSNKK